LLRSHFLFKAFKALFTFRIVSFASPFFCISHMTLKIGVFLTAFGSEGRCAGRNPPFVQ